MLLLGFVIAKLILFVLCLLVPLSVVTLACEQMKSIFHGGCGQGDVLETGSA